MKTIGLGSLLVAVLAVGISVGCSDTAKTRDVEGNIRHSLEQAGYKDVTVSQDRDKGVVTLGGKVAMEADKAHAEQIAKAIAGAQVVSDEIAVLPRGVESDAKAMNSDLDQAIEKNLDAVLIQNKLHDFVKYEVKNNVVTLTGKVDSQAKRQQAEKIAASVPNVRQVVNELQVKSQKATSSE